MSLASVSFAGGLRSVLDVEFPVDCIGVAKSKRPFLVAEEFLVSIDSLLPTGHEDARLGQWQLVRVLENPGFPYLSTNDFGSLCKAVWQSETATDRCDVLLDASGRLLFRGEVESRGRFLEPCGRAPVHTLAACVPGSKHNLRLNLTACVPLAFDPTVFDNGTVIDSVPIFDKTAILANKLVAVRDEPPTTLSAGWHRLRVNHAI